MLASREPVTLRSLVAGTGVSTMAVYTYFDGMAGLWGAVRQEGFRRLEQRIGAVPASRDPVRHLAALGVAYVENALSNPNLYRAMFDATFDLPDPAAADATLRAPDRRRGTFDRGRSFRPADRSRRPRAARVGERPRDRVAGRHRCAGRSRRTTPRTGDDRRPVRRRRRRARTRPPIGPQRLASDRRERWELSPSETVGATLSRIADLRRAHIQCAAWVTASGRRVHRWSPCARSAGSANRRAG